MKLEPRTKRLLQTAIHVSSYVAPALTVKFIWALFNTPLVASKPTASQAEQLAKAKLGKVTFGQSELTTYRWGENGPTILALHGWGGRAHVFGDLIPALLEAGFSVVSFDAPGHARLGQRTNMMEYSSAVRAVARDIGPVWGLVGHSFGAFTAAYTAPKLAHLKALALIGTPDRLDFLLEYARQIMDAPEHIWERLGHRIEKLSGEPVEDHATSLYLRAQNLPKIVIHDTDDKEVPIQLAREMASQLQAEIFETSGFGHHRILHSTAVAEKLSDFFKRELSQPQDNVD